jgi:hypothetical protein
VADRAWRFLGLSHTKRQGENFVLASAYHQLEPGGGRIAVAVEEETYDQNETDLEDAVAERLAEFQCEDLQRGG